MRSADLKFPIAAGLAIFLVNVFAFTAETGQSESGDEECIFDQAEQHKAYLELEGKYPGSRYVEDRYELRIPENENQVILRRGGCVHFGIYIQLRTERTDQFEDEAAFFARVSRLITDYGQRLLTPDMLETSRAQQASTVMESDDGVYYVLPHPAYVFEVWRRHDEEHTTIGVSIYD